MEASCVDEGPVGPGRAVDAEALPVGFEGDRGCRNVALHIAKRGALYLVAKKGGEGRFVEDEKVGSVGSWIAGIPGELLIEEMVAEGDGGWRRRVEEGGEREEDAEGEDGNQQDDGAEGGEPARAQAGEQEQKKLVACHRSRIEEGVEVVRGGGPFCNSREDLEQEDGDCGTEEKVAKFCRDAQPEDTKENDGYRQKDEDGGRDRDVRLHWIRLTKKRATADCTDKSG